MPRLENIIHCCNGHYKGIDDGLSRNYETAVMKSSPALALMRGQYVPDLCLTHF